MNEGIHRWRVGVYILIFIEDATTEHDRAVAVSLVFESCSHGGWVVFLKLYILYIPYEGRIGKLVDLSQSFAYV